MKKLSIAFFLVSLTILPSYSQNVDIDEQAVQAFMGPAMEALINNRSTWPTKHPYLGGIIDYEYNRSGLYIGWSKIISAHDLEKYKQKFLEFVTQYGFTKDGNEIDVGTVYMSSNYNLNVKVTTVIFKFVVTPDDDNSENTRKITVVGARE